MSKLEMVKYYYDEENDVYELVEIFGEIESEDDRLIFISLEELVDYVEDEFPEDEFSFEDINNNIIKLELVD